MNHSMKLYEGPFNDIRLGNKTIEVRLYDEKRGKLELGDIIEFTKLPDSKEKIQVKINGLLRYTTFKGLIDDFPLDCLDYIFLAGWFQI